MSKRKLIIPDPITDDFILNLFITSKNKLNPNYIRDKWLDENLLIKQYLSNRFNDNCSNISEIIYRIKNNIENIPLCKMCNNPISFRGFLFGYSTYCSHKCAWKCDETFEKSRKSLLLKYGDENYGKFGSSSYKDKMKNKYGTEFPLLLNWVKDKVCKTIYNHYGVYQYFQSEKCIKESHSQEAKKKKEETYMLHYGFPYYFLTNESIIKSHTESANNKRKLTCLEKYGVEYPTQRIEFKLNKIIRLTKVYNTKKKNNSFHISKIELQFKEYLDLDYLNDFEYLYRSELYPFNCDFYIKSLDLYIEILGTWLHGGHPFDENNLEDIDKLNLWKQKNQEFIINHKNNNLYKDAINVWTNRDIKKRNIAKENNLNYLEIFSIKLDECINQLNTFILKNK